MKSFPEAMPRNYIRKTESRYSNVKMNQAIAAVGEGQSVTDAAAENGVPKSTLRDHLARAKQLRLNKRCVFSIEQEKLLKNYLTKLCEIGEIGTWSSTRDRAYNYLCSVGCLTIPVAWQKKKQASVDWLCGFRSRHPDFQPCFSMKFWAANGIQECARDCGTCSVSLADSSEDFLLCTSCHIWNCSACCDEFGFCFECAQNKFLEIPE